MKGKTMNETNEMNECCGSPCDMGHMDGCPASNVRDDGDIGEFWDNLSDATKKALANKIYEEGRRYDERNQRDD